MRPKMVIAAVLLVIGLLVSFSAAAIMDAGASWTDGAIRGVVGIIFMSIGGVLGKYAKFEEVEIEEDISEWRDAS